MGTRNLTMVFHEGKYKLAQYCQWDGYPTGQGKTVLSFLWDKMDREKFLDRLDKCRILTITEIQPRWKDCGADDSGYVSLDISRKFKDWWPTLNRDIGAEVLEVIQKQC